MIVLFYGLIVETTSQTLHSILNKLHEDINSTESSKTKIPFWM